TKRPVIVSSLVASARVTPSLSRHAYLHNFAVLRIPSPSRGRTGWGWGKRAGSSKPQPHPHLNPPLEGEEIVRWGTRRGSRRASLGAHQPAQGSHVLDAVEVPQRRQQLPGPALAEHRGDEVEGLVLLVLARHRILKSTFRRRGFVG